MTTPALTAALRASAAGFSPLQADVGLLIAHDVFLHRNDFANRFVSAGHRLSR